jgi:deoxyribose-phosphate aldolase
MTADPTSPIDAAALARRAIALVDLTDLDDHTTSARVIQLCERATRHGTAAVCVWPDFVELASGLLSGTAVRVATVVNFPTGDERAFATGVLTERCLADGADEIDVVLPYRAFVAGDTGTAAAMLGTVRAASAGRTMKVILETGELGDLDTVSRASRMAIDRGADFVKTSTGKSPVAATIDAARAMLFTIHEADRPVGLKPSGGIRTVADAAAYLALADEVMGEGWAAPATFRFGASGLLDALVSAARGDDAPADEPIGY